ncbi:MAG: hypothetical protein ACKVY0_30620 [Prosthecobacter sp.]|uniref:hypothetical protein n=1 Tax=Prosthecobacter sp. TaxID=1965333 RepID=UPI0038FEED58
MPSLAKKASFVVLNVLFIRLKKFRCRRWQGKPNQTNRTKNMMMTKLRKMGLAAAACMLLGTNAAEAAAILTFKQEGSDVTATWSGTFQLPGSFTNSYQDGSSYVIMNSYSARLMLGNGAAYTPVYADGVGTSFTSTLANQSGYAAITGSSPATGHFGFEGGRLYWGSGALAGTLLSPDSKLTLYNKTLAQVGAASFNNFLAFEGSANVAGNQQIFFETVPEPSVASFGLLGLSGILLQRRRKAKAGSVQ